MPIKLMLVSVFINRMEYPYCIPAWSLTLNAALIVGSYINPPAADQPKTVITYFLHRQRMPLYAECFNFATHEYVIKNKT